MDSDEESNTTASSFDDDNDSYDDKVNGVEVDVGSNNMEDEENQESEWNWNENFIQNTSFPSKDVKRHTAINFTENMNPVNTFNKL